MQHITIYYLLLSDGEVWICKPTGRNQGKGIFLVKSKEEVDQLIQESDERGQQQTQGKLHRPLNRIIQRSVKYICISCKQLYTKFVYTFGIHS